jgi:hypothetical protein
MCPPATAFMDVGCGLPMARGRRTPLSFLSAESGRSNAGSPKLILLAKSCKP